MDGCYARDFKYTDELLSLYAAANPKVRVVPGIDSVVPCIKDATGLVKSANPAVRVYPCVNCFHHKTAQSIRDSAAEYADTAADGIYLFNAPYVGKRDTDGRKHAEDSFGLICREGLLLKRW